MNLPSIQKHLRHLIGRFLQRTDGIIVHEFIIALPVFLFATVGVYSYWDAYRSLNTAEKAAYAVSDLISRETRTINVQYLNGLHDVMEYMMGNDLPVQMRVTSITYSGVRSRYEVIWSRSPYAELPQLTTTSLQALVPNLPIVSDGDSLILVEARVQFTPSVAQAPAFNMYVGETEFDLFIPTRPRFLSKICLQNVACG
ncbi:MAG: hypothetical protein MUF74_03205 [Cypionkella sp.]|jgi:hypothetical protein|nr:hypothetical protein [Cypionkella sp.]